MHQHLTSMISDQRHPGFRRLVFDSALLEDEFRRTYAESSYSKTRPLLVGAGGLILLAIIGAMVQSNLTWFTAAFVLGLVLPTLVAALLLSYRENFHESYHTALALTAFWIGLLCTSITSRGSLNGTPYYFGAEVAWVLVVWLVLGLRFTYAGGAAVILSLTYVWGALRWNFPLPEVIFSACTLLAVNVIGAYCCYQLESAIRAAFFESRALNELAERDGLTGLYNRRRFDELMEKLWRQSRRDQSQFTLMLLDIDHFKAFNDLYGHQAGDDALKRVAEAITHWAQRPLDFAARYGGEEFALVLYGPAQDSSRDLPEQVRRAIEDLKIPHAESSTGPWLTISIGVAVISAGAKRSLAGAIQLADEALYQAKEEGRNRVVVRESRLAHIQTGRFRATRREARVG